MSEYVNKKFHRRMRIEIKDLDVLIHLQRERERECKGTKASSVPSEIFESLDSI